MNEGKEPHNPLVRLLNTAYYLRDSADYRQGFKMALQIVAGRYKNTKAIEDLLTLLKTLNN